MLEYLLESHNITPCLVLLHGIREVQSLSHAAEPNWNVGMRMRMCPAAVLQT